jgi:pilin isopeptide linkage protein
VKGATITVSGTKTLTGRDWQEGDSFTFKLEQQEGNTWKELGKKTITYNPADKNFNQFDFSDILKNLTFEKVGNYTFRLSEVKGTLENMTYDETINYFHVAVTDQDMDGKLEIREVTGSENAKVTQKDGKYTVDVPFNNTYVPPALPDPEPVEVQIRVDKTVENTGTKKINAKGFAFLLQKDGTHDKWEVKSDDAGQASFKLSFTKKDIGKTYTYRLSETNTGMKGVTYDSRVYVITVTVSYNDKDNTIVATVKVDGKQTAKPAAAFKNIYYIPPSDIPQTGDPNNVGFWAIMMAVSGTAFVTLLVYDRKQRKKEE